MDGEFFSANLFGHAIQFGKIQVVALASILIRNRNHCLAVKSQRDVASVPVRDQDPFGFGSWLSARFCWPANAELVTSLDVECGRHV